MCTQHKCQSNVGSKGLESKEGERRHLCCNNADNRSPSLGFNPNSEFVSEDDASTLVYKRDNPDFPLRRFISHPSGKKLTGCWSKGRNKKYPYYLFHGEGLEFKRDSLEDSFIAFYDKFGLNENQILVLKAKLKNNLIKATEEKRKEMALAQRQVLNLKDRQKVRIQKNLEGEINNDMLKEQLEYIESEMTQISPRIVAPIEFTKQNFEAAFYIVEKHLKKPSSVWQIAPLDCKLKTQWFNFPKGITFDGEKISNQRNV